MTTTQPAEKILVVGPAWVGDMVMSQTLYQAIKARNPDAVIDVIAPKHSGPLANRMPEIRRFIELPLGHGALALKQRYAIGKSLRAEDYTQAIVLPNSWKSAIVPFAACIPRRTGWVGEMRYGLLNDIRHLDRKKLPLMIERFMALGFPAGKTLEKPYPWPTLSTQAADVDAALASQNMTRPQKPVLSLCPGAEFGPAKRWPEQYFAEVAKAYLDKGFDVWIFGSPKEAPQAAHIQSVTNNRCVDLVGKTSLAQAIDLMSLSTAVISNDSGLMHIAAALQKPLVVMYGSSSPEFTPPLSHDVRVLNLNLPCSPCFKRECPLGHLNCLNHLKPQAVMNALQELI